MIGKIGRRLVVYTALEKYIMVSVDENKIISKSRYSRLFVVAFATIFVFSNWIDFKYVKTLDLMTIVGVFPFILSFLILDIITEVYGYKLARFSVWCGVICSVILLLFAHFVTECPSCDLSILDGVFLRKSTLIMASVFAAFFSQSLNSYLMSTLKNKMKGENLVTRLSISALLSTAVDSIIVILVIFYNLISIQQLVAKILSLWFFKIASIFISLPFIVILCNKIKSIEKLDIFDKTTDFNPFKFETNYTNYDNHFSSDQK